MAEDPSNFLTNPPQTVVKVVNTTREDMNGVLGIAVGFQNGRYLVHNVATQQTLSLRPENLQKASTIESARAQYQQLRNDPRLQQQIRDFYDKAKQQLHPVKPEYALLGVLLAWLGLIYFVGFTKTLMVTSIVLMMGVLVAPDVLQGASLRTIAQNLPNRSRQAIEDNLPFLRGRLSNHVAMGIVVLMIVLAGKSLFVGTKAPVAPPLPQSTRSVPHTSTSSSRVVLQEEFYKLGFDDAKNGLDYGTSLLQHQASATPTSASVTGPARSLADVNDEFPPYEEERYVPPPPPRRRFGSSFGIGTVMSAMYLYRIGMQLGRDVDGRFSFERMIANGRNMEVWQFAMAGISVYKLVRSFI